MEIVHDTLQADETVEELGGYILEYTVVAMHSLAGAIALVARGLAHKGQPCVQSNLGA